MGLAHKMFFDERMGLAHKMFFDERMGLAHKMFFDERLGLAHKMFFDERMGLAHKMFFDKRMGLAHKMFLSCSNPNCDYEFESYMDNQCKTYRKKQGRQQCTHHNWLHRQTQNPNEALNKIIWTK